MGADPERRARTQDALERSGLAALVAVSPQEVLLLTGYWPVMAASLAIATSDDRLICIVPEDEVELARATSSAELIAYHPAELKRIVSLSDALRDPFEQALKGVPDGPVGLRLSSAMEPNPYLATHQLRITVRALIAALRPARAVQDAGRLLVQMMSVKTQPEIDAMRRACSKAAIAFAVAREAIQPGRHENEVAADVAYAFATSESFGFERSEGNFFCMSGPNSYVAYGAYARTRRRRLEDGDLVLIHANTVGDGYWTDITRTWVAGSATEPVDRMCKAVREAREAALRAVWPGQSARAVDAAAREVLERHGFRNAFKHSTGHGVGFAAANARALPRLHPDSPDTLVPGMTFNIEPALYVEGVGGLRHCDVVACRNDGAEVLTDF